jgi:voltage-gated potassium channel
MSTAQTDSQPLDDPASTRDRLRHHVHHYLNLPVALASILFVLIAFTHISGTGSVPWHRRFWHGPPAILLWLIWGGLILEFLAKFSLAPRKQAYLQRHWPDVLVALAPFTGILRLLDALVVSPLVRLLLGRRAHPHLAILAKRKLDRLALISALVILIAAVLAYIFESGARGSTMPTFGDALWWAAATATTVANQLYPVTAGGEIVAFGLMLFAIGVFSYLTSSFASALIGGDAQENAQSDQSNQVGQTNASSDQGAAQTDTRVGAGAVPTDTSSAQGATEVTICLSKSELETLRAILNRAQQQTG